MTEERNGLPELPKGWVWTTIGEVTQPIEKVMPKENPDTQFTYLDISSIDNQLNKVVEPKIYYGSEAPSRARQLVRAHDVLFSTVRTYLKNIALVSEIYDGQIASTGFSVLRGESGISPKYLFYYSLTDQFINPLSELQRGTSYPAVRDSDVRAQPIPLSPLPEQQRIVAKIEELFTQLDAGVAALEKAKAQLRRYRQAVLKAAVEGELTREWREAHRGELEPASVLLKRIKEERKQQATRKYKELHSVDASDLPDLPGGWVWAKIGEITEVIRGASPRPKGDPRYFGGSIPWIKISDISKEKGRYLSRTKETVTEEGAKKSRYLKAGTLILSNSGTVCVPKILTVDGCIHDGFVAFPDLTEDVDILHLYYYFEYIRPRIIQENRQGVTQVNLNTNIVRDISISLPPLAEQKRIVEQIEMRLSVADEMEKAVEQSLKRAERLRQSILKRAFEGRLVPQDPSDEPASVLLECIKAEKARREGEGKGKRKGSGRRRRKTEEAEQLRML